MNAPKIDLSSVPGLDFAQGLFGSIKQTSAAYDDGVVNVMVYVYDIMPPDRMVG